MDFRDPLHIAGLLIAVPGSLAGAVYLIILLKRRMTTPEWRREAPAERVIAVVGLLFFEAVLLFNVGFGIWRAFIMR